jgi:nucleotide-binding universal stress UspA family protein
MFTGTVASNQSMCSLLPEPAALSREKGSAALAEILVFIDGRTKAGGILEFAGALAEEHGARLIGVFLQPEPTIAPAETFARGTGMLRVSEVHRAQLARIDADYRALFEDIVRRHRIRPESEWISLSYLNNEVGVHAYHADLVVIARPQPAAQTARPPGLAESLILTSGRPIIVFPSRSTVSRVRRILVGWNARRESIRAVADALPLLVKAEAVEVLVVDHERTAGHGQEPGADIARHLARHSVQVGVRRLSSGKEEVGHLLLSQAAAFGADLLVMGAYGHSQLSEWMFGSVTRTVLGEAGLPVLMSR